MKKISLGLIAFLGAALVHQHASAGEPKTCYRMEERTVKVPTWIEKTKDVWVTEHKMVTKTRKVKKCKTIPVVKKVPYTYTIHVPEKKWETEIEYEEEDVCEPQQQTYWDWITVPEVRTDYKRTLKTEKKIVKDHCTTKEVCEETIIAVPYDYTVMVSKPLIKERTILVNRTIFKPVEKKVCKIEQVPVKKMGIREETTYVKVEEWVDETYTECVPVKVKKQVTEKVCVMVEKKICVKVPICEGPCDH